MSDEQNEPTLDDVLIREIELESGPEPLSDEELDELYAADNGYLTTWQTYEPEGWTAILPAHRNEFTVGHDRVVATIAALKERVGDLDRMFSAEGAALGDRNVENAKLRKVVDAIVEAVEEDGSDATGFLVIEDIIMKYQNALRESEAKPLDSCP